MSDRFEGDIEALGRSFIAPVSADALGDDPAGLRPYVTATALRSGNGVPARLGDLLLLELEARALAPLFAVVGDLHRLRRFYVGLGERIALRGDLDGDPDDALEPEAVEILDWMRDHVNRRVEWLADRRSEPYLHPDEDMPHVAAFYETDETEPTG